MYFQKYLDEMVNIFFNLIKGFALEFSHVKTLLSITVLFNSRKLEKLTFTVVPKE